MRQRSQILILLLMFILLIPFTACRGDDPDESDFVLTGQLSISGPESATVGDVLEFIVAAPSAPDGTSVVLSLLGGAGANLLRAEFENGAAWFQIPATFTTRSGMVTVIASSGDASGETSLMLNPGPAVEPITPLIGPRSIVADGDHWSMVVAIPFDQYGNPVAEGTAVDIRALHPENNLEIFESEISHLLAWERLFSGTKAGRTIVAVNIEEAHGPEGVLLEIPGWPGFYSIMADPPILPADGFQLTTLRSTLIADQYGNVMPDGTQVSFVVTGPNGGKRVLPTQTVDGIAETIMQAPQIAGDYTIYGVTFGVESEPLTVTFTPGPAVGMFPVDIAIDDTNGELEILAGPITGVLDQYVPDGTPVQFIVTDPDGMETPYDAFTDLGYAVISLRLAQIPAGMHRVEATAGAGSGRTRFIIPE